MAAARETQSQPSSTYPRKRWRVEYAWQALGSWGGEEFVCSHLFSCIRQTSRRTAREIQSQPCSTYPRKTPAPTHYYKPYSHRKRWRVGCAWRALGVEVGAVFTPLSCIHIHSKYEAPSPPTQMFLPGEMEASGRGRALRAHATLDLGGRRFLSYFGPYPGLPAAPHREMFLPFGQRVINHTIRRLREDSLP